MRMVRLGVLGRQQFRGLFFGPFRSADVLAGSGFNSKTRSRGGAPRAPRGGRLKYAPATMAMWNSPCEISDAMTLKPYGALTRNALRRESPIPAWNWQPISGGEARSH